MRSWKLGRFWGIDLEIHWTTILFIAFLLIFSPIYALVLVLLFFIISVHEMSHAVVAKRFGIGVSRIVLLPIGGMAMMEESNLEPKSEFFMAIAGPMANFIMALAWVILVQILGIPIYSLGTWNSMVSGKIPINWLGLASSSFFWLNWLLGAFNLFVPAIPMDGGRVLRALLAFFMDYVKATRIAVYVSKVLTGLMFLLSILTFNIILFFISIFLWIGSSVEYEQAVNMTVMPKIDLRKLLIKKVPRARPNAKVKTVLQRMVKSNSTQVFLGQDLIVTVDDIKDADPEKPARVYARKITPVHLGKPEVIMKSFLAQNCQILPVTDGKRITGYLDVRDLERAIELAKLIWS